MEDFKLEFTRYLITLINDKPDTLKDVRSKSHYFNEKVTEKYSEFLIENPRYSEAEVKIATSDIRVKYQIMFVR